MDSAVEGHPAEVGLVALHVTPVSPRLRVGGSVQFRAWARYADTPEGEDGVEVTAEVVWSSSDPSVLAFESARQPGLASVRGDTRVEVTARLGLTSETLAMGSACSYPPYASQVRLGEGVPPLFWEPAFGPDGRPFTYRLEDVACNEDVNLIALVLGTGWCGACSAYAARLNQDAADHAAAGVEVIYVELERTDYQPADSQFAYDHLRRVIGDGPGVRVGDLDTKPTAGFLTHFAQLDGLPTVYLIRRRDMKVLTTRAIVGDRPLREIAENLDADWLDPPPLVFRSTCGPDDEEPHEPNDAPAQATPLSPGEHPGGVCDPIGDFYRIDLAGRWRVDLRFRNAQGDLDVYIWDPASDAPARINGDTVGSDGTGDHEQFEHQGPALIKVLGFRQATGPYVLTLTDLSQ